MASRVSCMEWCSNPCEKLNGNLTLECGGCLPNVECNPLRFLPHDRSTLLHQPAPGIDDEESTQQEVLPSALQLICPTSRSLLGRGMQSLPATRRYCLRAPTKCARVDSAVAWHLENIQSTSVKQTRAAIIHHEKPSVGAGFAHVLQEHAMLLLLSLVLSRPLHLHQEEGIFNIHGSLLGPAPSLRRVLYRWPARAAGFSSMVLCQSAKQRRADAHAGSSRLPTATRGRSWTNSRRTTTGLPTWHPQRRSMTTSRVGHRSSLAHLL
jgi:hypothetical protein